MSARRSIAAVGDVTDVNCWSGIPFHFWRAARAAGFADVPWQLDLEDLRWPRRFWNLARVLRGKAPGGFQYSPAFLRRAAAQIPVEFFRTEILSFHQHFPLAEQVVAAGGELNHYLDATFAALTSNRGLDLHLPPDVVSEARAMERQNYAASRRVLTMARWTAQSVIQDCGVAAEKVCTILPGANLDLPPDDPGAAPPPGRAGKERAFVLGFVGQDWRRKGLPFLIEVRNELARRGWKTLVQAAGAAPEELARHDGVRFVGRIEKRGGSGAFVKFLRECDLGCLFSTNEALGISTLEFLRAGVPVAGFAHQGLADTLPPDAGFCFPLHASASAVADELEKYLRDENRQDQFRRRAAQWSPLMTWERCVREMMELWQTGRVASPVRPWLGFAV